jgi:hypothetical protein
MLLRALLALALLAVLPARADEIAPGLRVCFGVEK